MAMRNNKSKGDDLLTSTSIDVRKTHVLRPNGEIESNIVIEELDDDKSNALITMSPQGCGSSCISDDHSSDSEIKR